MKGTCMVCFHLESLTIDDLQWLHNRYYKLSKVRFGLSYTLLSHLDHLLVVEAPRNFHLLSG